MEQGGICILVQQLQQNRWVVVAYATVATTTGNHTLVQYRTVSPGMVPVALMRVLLKSGEKSKNP